MYNKSCVEVKQANVSERDHVATLATSTVNKFAPLGEHQILYIFKVRLELFRSVVYSLSHLNFQYSIISGKFKQKGKCALVLLQILGVI